MFSFKKGRGGDPTEADHGDRYERGTRLEGGWSRELSVR